MGTITDLFSGPFFTGTGSTTTLVPGKFQVALDGHAYNIDTAHSTPFQHRSVPMVRAQADQSAEPGEASISREDLWRRKQERWVFGAGQDFLDRDDSLRSRFAASKGIDVWTDWQFQLLPDTDEKLSSANTNLKVMRVDTRLWVSDGSDLKYTSDVTADSPSFTTLAVGSTIQDFTSDGHYIYVTDGADVFQFDATAGTPALGAAWNTLDCDVLGYVKGRLMAAHDDVIYNITSSTPPAALLTPDLNDDFRWVGFAAGPGHIYAAGYSGDKSLIYKTAVKADGTALDAPTPAGELPDGEIVTAIYGYMGLVFIGTGLGLRMAVVDANGNLTIGEMVNTGTGVRCFEGQEEFVWFGWDQYDATETGLGRLSPVYLNGSKPAYASDLMVTDTGNVLSICTFNDLRVFAISGAGIYAEHTDKVASGTLETGDLNFNVAGMQKTAVYLTVDHDGGGTMTPSIGVDGGSYSALTAQTSASTRTPVGEEVGDKFRIKIQLDRNGSDATVGPIVDSWLLEVLPKFESVEQIIAPVTINDQVEWGDGVARMNVDEEINHIRDVKSNREIVVWQEGAEGFSVIVDDYEWFPKQMNESRTHWTGTMVLYMKVM